MKTAQRKILSKVMTSAWMLARQGAERFGGTAPLYFAVALHLVWLEAKAGKSRTSSVWQAGIGNWIWMPGVPLPEQVKKGQAVLPGLLLN